MSSKLMTAGSHVAVNVTAILLSTAFQSKIKHPIDSLITHFNCDMPLTTFHVVGKLIKVFFHQNYNNKFNRNVPVEKLLQLIICISLNKLIIIIIHNTIFSWYCMFEIKMLLALLFLVQEYPYQADFSGLVYLAITYTKWIIKKQKNYYKINSAGCNLLYCARKKLTVCTDTIWYYLNQVSIINDINIFNGKFRSTEFFFIRAKSKIKCISIKLGAFTIHKFTKYLYEADYYYLLMEQLALSLFLILVCDYINY
ncbi:hypothetical protein AGLY_011119 [Aphis glycines]|uniref:Uncharacterized protein n=1 Tax=Aphis glycines TaxID=307491 RepID=A0A6G0TES2_APHGL|nr:hypothetical protein AGLY_011119 [Aphis glycines]